ncbi:lycopene cyclase family protein [Algoriphagus litoralis]|uniref:lycopene cyclase family protein n=1 Tax=Algoriphagus litoralis TaxID=2202829 RepID=UPI000DB90D46|nr:lycopene cyclase family protein [Algoriphagus litoralis]
MKHYTYIFAGAGCAGLSLVYYLLESSLKDASILLIEPLGKSIPKKTWCYWAEKPLEIHPKDQIHSWKNISLSSGSAKITGSMGRLAYFHLNSEEFYTFIYQKIKNHSNVTCIQDEVLDLQEFDNQVRVKTEKNGLFLASLVFDSRLQRAASAELSILNQEFTGWKIKTEQPVFNPESVVLMEFPTLPSKTFDFIYILPFSSTEALVEYTAYTQKSISEPELASSLRKYLNENLKEIPYQITFKEHGVIPMSTRNQSFSCQKNVIKIGTAAGWTKASTGFTFHTIQKNCQKLVKEMETGKSNPAILPSSIRFSFYDNILLNIAFKWPEKLQGLFLNLFETSSAETVLRFLSEDTSLGEEFVLLMKLRFSIFVKSLMNYESH